MTPACRDELARNDTVLPEVKPGSIGPEPARTWFFRIARWRSGPYQSSRSLSSSLSLPASSRTALCFASAFPCFPSKRESPPRFQACLRLPRSHPDSCGAHPHPAAGRMPPRSPRVRGSHSQRLPSRRRRFAPPPTRPAGERVRAPLVVSLSLTASLHRVWSGECSRGLGYAGPGDPATDPHSDIRDVTHLPSHGAFNASALAGGYAASVSRPNSGPMPTPILLSALSALPSSLPNRLPRVRSQWSNPGGRSLVAAEPAGIPPLHPVALSAPRSSGAGPSVSRDTGRAAVGRPGPVHRFNLTPARKELFCRLSAFDPDHIRDKMNELIPIRCGMYIAPKKRPKFGFDDFIATAKQHGVLVEDLDLEGEHANLPTNLDIILHKVT